MRRRLQFHQDLGRRFSQILASTPKSSESVIWTLATQLRFQIGSRNELASHQLDVLSANDIQDHFDNESGPLFWPDLAYFIWVARRFSGNWEVSPGFLPAFSPIASLVSPGLSR